MGRLLYWVCAVNLTRVIGNLVRGCDQGYNDGTYRVVAIIQAEAPPVVLLRYETAASEPNWCGTEGYVLAQVNADGTMEDPNGHTYKSA